MANGNSALQLLAPEPAQDAPAGATKGKPDAPAEAAGKPDGALGVAVADAVFTLYRAIIDQQERGLLHPAIKDEGGSRIAAIAMLQLDHAGDDNDFVARAHRDGKRELRRFFSNTGLFQQHDPVEIDKEFDTNIADVLGIVSEVVKTERIYRTAWAN